MNAKQIKAANYSDWDKDCCQVLFYVEGLGICAAFVKYHVHSLKLQHSNHSVFQGSCSVIIWLTICKSGSNHVCALRGAGSEIKTNLAYLMSYVPNYLIRVCYSSVPRGNVIG